MDNCALHPPVCSPACCIAKFAVNDVRYNYISANRYIILFLLPVWFSSFSDDDILSVAVSIIVSRNSN